MDTIEIIFTKRQWNPMSWVIRWVLPRTRFAMATTSHCLIVDGGFCIEAHMLHGVVRRPAEQALKGLTIVERVSYTVPCAAAGLMWARSQVGKKYDWAGALGMLAPNRQWTEDDKWFCYELGAAILRAAGRETFTDFAHITGSMLASLKP